MPELVATVPAACNCYLY